MRSILGCIRSLMLVLGLAVLIGAATGNQAQAQCVFIRGDINDSGVVDLNDAVDILAFIFIGASVPVCPAVADVNDNGLVELSDYIYMAQWIFGDPKGPPPPAPFTEPGVDPTPGITVPADRDPRFQFKIGHAIGFASNTGLKIPLYVTNQVPINGFQMVFQYDGRILRIDEMLPDETALKDVNAEYIIHQAFNRPGISNGGYSCLIDFATPIAFRVLPAGTDQLVGNLIVSISLIADPGEATLEFVDGVKFPDEDPPEKRVSVENVVILGSTVVRPGFSDGKVVIRKAFVRGDANQDKRIDISDSIFMLSYIFLGTTAPKCHDAADVNNDSRLDISDPIFLLNFTFQGGPQPSSPYPVPGVDPDRDTLGCGTGI